MIRDALLNSDRFLSLPDNTARMCFVACLLNADDRGNLEASTGALVRMWRDFGVDSNAKAEDTSQFLSDKDLIRLYETASKRYMHVPRFGQRMRSFKRACPPSPWCETSEESSKSSGICQQVAANSGKSRPEVKRREEKYPLAQTAFARFWAAYPRRKNRGQAERAWQKLKPSEQLIAQILQAIERATTSESWQKESGRFIPYPASWLNAKGWLDEDGVARSPVFDGGVE
jgi:hypothetical protein